MWITGWWCGEGGTRDENLIYVHSCLLYYIFSRTKMSYTIQFVNIILDYSVLDMLKFRTLLVDY